MDDLDPFLGSAAGLPRHRLRSASYRRLSRDVYAAAAAPDAVGLMVHALLVAIPDAVLSHHDAAWALGLPVDLDDVVHLTRDSDAAVSTRAGVVVHRSALGPGEVVTADGVRVTSPVRTFLDLASMLSFTELVVLGDAVVRRVSTEALMRAAQLARGRRGVRRARAAAAMADPRADSPAETRTRLILHAAGFTGLRHGVQVTLHGHWVAAPDLADPVARVAVQYDGLVHLLGGAEQWRSDIDRDELTRAAGWEVVVLTARDLREPASAIAKVRAAYDRAAARTAA